MISDFIKLYFLVEGYWLETMSRWSCVILILIIEWLIICWCKLPFVSFKKTDFTQKKDGYSSPLSWCRNFEGGIFSETSCNIHDAANKPRKSNNNRAFGKILHRSRCAFFAPWKSTPRSRSPCITQLTLGAPYITGQSALSREGGQGRGGGRGAGVLHCLPGRLICIQQHTRPFFTKRFITRLMSGEQLLTIGRLSFTRSALLTRRFGTICGSWGANWTIHCAEYELFSWSIFAPTGRTCNFLWDLQIHSALLWFIFAKWVRLNPLTSTLFWKGQFFNTLY